MLARSAAIVSGVVKAPTGTVFRSLNEAKISRLLPFIEFSPYVPVRRLAHGATKRVAEDRSLVGNGLALEDVVAGEGDGLLRGKSMFRLPLLLFSPGAGCGDDLLRLISEGRRHLLVRGKDLIGSQGLLPITGRVGRNLRGLRAAVAGLFQLLPDLARARTRGVKVLLCVTFDFRSPTPSSFDFIS